MRRELREKRESMVKQFDGAGLTIGEVADRLGWCVESVRKYQKACGAEFRHAAERTSTTGREEAMAAMYKSGKTLQEIGGLYGVSRERVRQILAKRFDYDASSGGQFVRSKAKCAEKARARDARSFEEHGCSYANYRKLSRIGSKMVASGESYYRSPVGAFSSQKASAGFRGIEWNINLWDWWKIWQSSGKWAQRGRNKGEYVMCRFHDTGAYEVGNVYIATNSHNCSLQPNNPHRVDHPDHKKIRDEVRRKRSCQSARVSIKRKNHDLPVGVTMSQGRFMAQISIRGKNNYLGMFGCPSAAHEAYRKALSEYLDVATSEAVQ